MRPTLRIRMRVCDGAVGLGLWVLLGTQALNDGTQKRKIGLILRSAHNFAFFAIAVLMLLV